MSNSSNEKHNIHRREFLYAISKYALLASSGSLLAGCGGLAQSFGLTPKSGATGNDLSAPLIIDAGTVGTNVTSDTHEAVSPLLAYHDTKSGDHVLLFGVRDAQGVVKRLAHAVNWNDSASGRGNTHSFLDTQGRPTAIASDAGQYAIFDWDPVAPQVTVRFYDISGTLIASGLVTGNGNSYSISPMRAAPLTPAIAAAPHRTIRSVSTDFKTNVLQTTLAQIESTATNFAWFDAFAADLVTPGTPAYSAFVSGAKSTDISQGRAVPVVLIVAGIVAAAVALKGYITFKPIIDQALKDIVHVLSKFIVTNAQAAEFRSDPPTPGSRYAYPELIGLAGQWYQDPNNMGNVQWRLELLASGSNPGDITSPHPGVGTRPIFQDTFDGTTLTLQTYDRTYVFTVSGLTMTGGDGSETFTLHKVRTF